MDPELFEYTNQSGVIEIEGVSDEVDFEDFLNSMNILQFSEEERTVILRLVGGVLHFGNIKFAVKQMQNAEDTSSISNMDTLAIACELWGLDVDDTEEKLTHRRWISPAFFLSLLLSNLTSLSSLFNSL